MLVVSGQAKGLAEIVTDGSAQLQGRPLSSDRSSQQVGEDRGEKDGGNHPLSDVIPGLDGRDDQVGSDGVVPVKQVIIEEDAGSAQGKEVDQPGVADPQVCRELNADIKKRPDYPRDDTADYSEDNPFERDPDPVQMDVNSFLQMISIHTVLPQRHGK